MLTVTLARDLIYKIPKCQVDKLSLSTWRCSDSDQLHTHTTFGNRIVRNSKIVPSAGETCKMTLKSALMSEAICKEAIDLEDWTCFDPRYKKCYVHAQDSCKKCGMDKMGRYMTIVDAWTQLAATQ